MSLKLIGLVAPWVLTNSELRKSGRSVIVKGDRTQEQTCLFFEGGGEVYQV